MRVRSVASLLSPWVRVRHPLECCRDFVASASPEQAPTLVEHGRLFCELIEMGENATMIAVRNGDSKEFEDLREWDRFGKDFDLSKQMRRLCL